MHEFVCDRFGQNQHPSKTPINYESLKNHLEKILLDRESNPSVAAVAKELGYDRRILTKKYPDLCHKISHRYMVSRKKSTQNRIKSYCIEVEAIARKLSSQGVYPSEVVVSKYLDKPGYFRYKQVRNTLKGFQDKNL